MRIPDIPESLLPPREHRHRQHIRVLMSIPTREVQMRLYLTVARTSPESGMTQLREQHRFRVIRRLQPFLRPRVVEGDDPAIRIAQNPRNPTRPFQDRQLLVQIHVLKFGGPIRRLIPGWITVAIEQIRQNTEPPHGLVVVGHSPLAPDPVGKELLLHEQADPACCLVHVIRFPQYTPRRDQTSQKSGVHVRQRRRVVVDESDHTAEQVFFDQPFRCRIQGTTVAHELIGSQQIFRYVLVRPPRPLRRPEIRHRIGEVVFA